jgi:putative protease
MKTELLSPAGSLKAMRYAYAYGADAVYLGQPRYSLRVRENEFSRHDVIAGAIEEAHAINKKVYIASNIAPHNVKVRTYLDDMKPVIEMNPDALIMSDPGLIMMVRETWPDMPVHLSVQANTVNFAAVKFWQKMGLTRIILSRELSIDEVKEIRQECPDIELEVFVHGALCIAYSGRCLLSGYMSKRDPNQGSCTNTCRWGYNATEAQQTPEGDIIPTKAIEFDPSQQASASENPAEGKLFLLEEKQRPGELMPAWEDEHGTYIMNSKDLRAVQHVKTLVDMGIDSLKIEGRTKTHFYAARTAQVYRRAIDDAMAGKEFDWDLMRQLESLANRGYTEGFYRRHSPEELQNYERGVSISDHQQFVAEVKGKTEQGLVLDVKNKFAVGDQLELMTPQGNVSFKLGNMANSKGHSIDVAPGSGYEVIIPVEGQVDASYGMLMRNLA